jgi:hypothetical protein
MAASTPISRKRVFPPSVMAGLTYISMSIPRFVPVEVVELLSSTLRKRSMITVARIIAVVDMAVKSMRSMEPGTRS